MINRHSGNSKFLYLLLVFLIVYYFTVPNEYDYYSITICSILTFGSFLYYLHYNKDKNSLSFDVIFLLSSLILYFVYPLFVYEDSTAYLFSFGLYYNVDYISKGVCIASIGLICFIIGCMSSPILYGIKRDSKCRSNLYLSIFCTLIYVLFYILGGFQYFVDVYKNGYRGSTISAYILILIQCSFPILILNELWNKKNNNNYHYSFYPFFITIVVASHFLLVGSRSNALLLILSPLIVYTEMFKRQSLKILILFFILGIFSMWFIQNIRAGHEIHSDSFKFYYIISDFLIPNTDTYIAADVVDSKGCSYGMTILSQFLSLIPFAQSFITSFGGLTDEDLSSSRFFTSYMNSNAGMGTNAIADLYLAFNLLGVVLVMFYFGKISVKWKNSLGINYYSSLYYAMLAGLSIYLVRASIFYSMRYFFYSLIISYLFCRKK